MSNFDGFVMESQYRMWEPGWYSGAIVAEYETGGLFPKLVKTEDVTSRNGDSRNLRLAIKLLNGDKEYDRHLLINYRKEALSDDRKAYLLEAAKKAKEAKSNLKGDDFRDFKSNSRFRELTEAGLTVELNGHGGLDASKLVGSAADFYLSIVRKVEGSDYDTVKITTKELKETPDDERKGWFGEITMVAKVGTKRK